MPLRVRIVRALGFAAGIRSPSSSAQFPRRLTPVKAKPGDADSYNYFDSPTPATGVQASTGNGNSNRGPVNNPGVGVFWLLLINFVLFGLDKFGAQMWVQNLYLNSAYPQWWQFITCTFCHFDWAHLSQNAFFLLVFGRLVEEEEGSFGVWATYLLCGIGGAVAAHLLGGGSGFSLGASGAVFGLFAVSVLVKLQWNLRKILECVILGQFVVKQVMTEVASQAAVTGKMVAGGVSVSHVAHLGGAMVGVLLVLAMSRLPEAK